MHLLADSGSTKTDWVLIENDKVKNQFQTTGINPYFKSSNEIAYELYPAFLRHFKIQSIKKINFYGAGCSSPTKIAVVKNALEQIFPNAEIFVNHDMLAAARALLGNKPGIACILGTGSNSCLYDGNSIVEKLFSLGYMFGDEGSGAHIGKTFIAKHLKNKTPEEIQEAFTKKYSLSKEDILTNVYQKANPNKFLASFTPFLKENIQHPYVKQLVESCFDDFIIEQVSKFTNFKNYPVCSIGSIAYHFKPNFESVLKKHELSLGKIVSSPIDELINYHIAE